MVFQLYPTTVHITAVKVEYTTPTGRLNKGVATSWLSNKAPPVDDGTSALVPIFIRKSQFKCVHFEENLYLRTYL